MVSKVFHLIRQEAKRELNIQINGEKIVSEEHPKYLGVKFDRTLIHNQHLEGVINILKTHNIMTNLAGTIWGCHNSVLPTIALAHVNSVAEYRLPVWTRSTHSS